MRTGLFNRAKIFDIPVLPYIIMITCAGESPAQVVCGQLMFGITTVATGSGTMNDDEVDKSHFL